MTRTVRALAFAFTGMLALLLFRSASAQLPNWPDYPWPSDGWSELVAACEGYGCVEVPESFFDGGKFGNYAVICVASGQGSGGIVVPARRCMKLPIAYEGEAGTWFNVGYQIVAGQTIMNRNGWLYDRYWFYPPAGTKKAGWSCALTGAESPTFGQYTSSSGSAWASSTGGWTKESSVGAETGVMNSFAHTVVMAWSGQATTYFDPLVTWGHVSASAESVWSAPSVWTQGKLSCLFVAELRAELVPTATATPNPVVGAATATAVAVATAQAGAIATQLAATPTVDAPQCQQNGGLLVCTPTPEPNAVATLLANWPTAVATPNFATLEAILAGMATLDARAATPNPALGTLIAGIATSVARGTHTPTVTVTPTPGQDGGSLSVGTTTPSVVEDAECWVVMPSVYFGVTIRARWMKVVTLGMLEREQFVGIDTKRVEICGRNWTLPTVEFLGFNLSTWVVGMLTISAVAAVARILIGGW